MNLEQGVFSLKGLVQNYSWGGFDFLPSFLGLPNDSHQPFAEYWMGAHPNHSAVVGSNGEPLSGLIERNKEIYLGKRLSSEFDSLPFLLKILDVRQMLSIQVHPDMKGAVEGFEREDQKGVPLTAPHRNYKDRNHKPELMVALGDFWLLHGFKDKKSLAGILHSVPELNFLQQVFEDGGYKALYEKVMLMPPEEVNEHLQPLVKRILPLYENHTLEKNQEDFWAARAALHFCKEGRYDRGIFSIYFFNLLHLKKGEGIFQKAGLPHAYLEGLNVEVMANSDNVLRAGLTDKHIDVAELMKHVEFKQTIPVIIPKKDNSHTIYHSPAREFELHQYELKKDDPIHFKTSSPEIILVLEGNVDIIPGGETGAGRGEAFFILPGTAVQLRPVQDTNLFRVRVPVVEN